MTKETKSANNIVYGLTENYELFLSEIEYSVEGCLWETLIGERAKKLLEVVNENGEFDLKAEIPEAEEYFGSNCPLKAKVREVGYDVFKRFPNGGLSRCIANTYSKPKGELLYSLEFERYIELGKPHKLFLRRSDELYL